MTIQERIFALRDEKYAAFEAKIIPNITEERFVGVRAPQLKALCKVIKDEAEDFMASLPHWYHEENQLHAYLVSTIKDFDRAIAEVERFLPYVDNWAVCDTMFPKAFTKYSDRLLPYIRKWMSSKHEYSIRYGINMLMRLYLDKEFKPEYLRWVGEVKRDEYYIKMMQAWYYATALAKQWDSTLPYLDGRLDLWVHNKTIQKAIESYRITDERKAQLRTMKKTGTS